MPSNTDDGIVEKVARALLKRALTQRGHFGNDQWFERQWAACEQAAYCDDAQDIIDVYLTHLRDKGMVVVPVMTESQPLMFSQTIVNEDDSPVDITRTVSASPVQSER